MAKDMMDSKHWMMHKRMMGVKMLILGALILANMYWGILNWVRLSAESLHYGD